MGSSKLGGESGSLLGYVRQNNSLSADTTSGNVSNLNFSIVQGDGPWFMEASRTTQTKPRAR